MTMTRWDFSKSRSNYHFDPTVNEDDNPPFKIVGRVEGDLMAHYDESRRKNPLRLNGFLNRIQVQKEQDYKPFTQDYDRNELEYLGLPEDHSFFYNLKCETDIIKTVRDAFCFLPMTGTGGSYHIQKPGQVFPYHVDEIPSIKDNDPNHWIDQQPHKVARLEIMMKDWEPGHVFGYGNTYWKQWKAGDIAWHDWRNTPHGTANFGRSDRITLQITGWTSAHTCLMLQEGGVVVRV